MVRVGVVLLGSGPYPLFVAEPLWPFLYLKLLDELDDQVDLRLCLPDKIIKGGQTLLVSHSREKLLNAIVFFARETKYCGITKLMKLLYYLDFIHFKQTGKSVTGQTYYAWDFGPVPKEVYEELVGPGSLAQDTKDAIAIVSRDDVFQEIVAKKGFDPLHFSPREKRLLSRVSEIFRDAKAEHMVACTHLKNSPWEKTIKTRGEYAPIEYMLALDDSEDSLSPEAAMRRITERLEMKEAFDEAGDCSTS